MWTTVNYTDLPDDWIATSEDDNFTATANVTLLYENVSVPRSNTLNIPYTVSNFELSILFKISNAKYNYFLSLFNHAPKIDYGNFSSNRSCHRKFPSDTSILSRKETKKTNKLLHNLISICRFSCRTAWHPFCSFSKHIFMIHQF